MTAMGILAPGVFHVRGDPAARSAMIDGRKVDIDGWSSVDLSRARLWSGEPPRGLRVPDWAIAQTHTALLAARRPGGLADLLDPCLEPASPILAAAAQSLSGVTTLGALVGLGPGLTPAGDDFLTGMLLAETVLRRGRLGEAERVSIAEALPGTSAPGRTLLTLALSGSFPAYLLTFVRALSLARAAEQVGAAVEAACRHGETSGSDALAGFLQATRIICHSAGARTSNGRSPRPSRTGSTTGSPRPEGRRESRTP